MKGKIIKWGLIIIVSGLFIGGGVIFYLFNMPHRDIQAAEIDYEMTATQLVKEYLDNSRTANDKYLQEDGESKILAVSGTVASIDEDLNQQKVVLIKSPDAMAGVSCTFEKSANGFAQTLKPGDQVKVKGVIRSGAGYDVDLEMYEDVIMEKCNVIIN